MGQFQLKGSCQTTVTVAYSCIGNSLVKANQELLWKSDPLLKAPFPLKSPEFSPMSNKENEFTNFVTLIDAFEKSKKAFLEGVGELISLTTFQNLALLRGKFSYYPWTPKIWVELMFCTESPGYTSV